MKKFLMMIAAVLASGLLLAGGAQAATFNVSVQNFFFQPDPLVINVGDTVTWTNNSGTFHTTTSGSNCSPNDVTWDAGLSGSGGTFSRTFNTPGTFPYFCRPHCSLGMTGTVVVNAAAMPAPSGGHSTIFQPVVSPVIGATMATSMPIGVGQFAVGGSTLDFTVGLGQYAAPVDLYLAVTASTLPDTILFLMPNLSVVSQTFGQVVKDFTAGMFPPNILPWMANVSSANATIFAGAPVSGIAAAQYGLFLLVVPHGGTLANYDLYGTSITVP